MRVPAPERSVMAAIIVAGALAGGCRQDPEVAAANERMCQATEGLGDALDAFADAEAGERAGARDALFDAMAELAHASSEVAQAESHAGNNPLHDLNEDIQQLGADDASLAEVAEGMAVAGGDFLEGVKGLVTGRDC